MTSPRELAAEIQAAEDEIKQCDTALNAARVAYEQSLGALRTAIRDRDPDAKAMTDDQLHVVVRLLLEEE